jgi:hypothetical protein
LFLRARVHARNYGCMLWVDTGRQERRRNFGSATLNRFGRRVACNLPQAGPCDESCDKPRGRTRGEKRDLTSKGVLIGPPCVGEKEEERELGGRRRRAAGLFQGLHAPTSHTRAGQDKRSPVRHPAVSSTHFRINTPGPCHPKRYLIPSLQWRRRGIARPAPPSDLPYPTRLATGEGWSSVFHRANPTWTPGQTRR